MRRLLLIPALMLSALAAHAAEQARNVSSFTAISNSGPISISIEVGKPQSVTAIGSDKFLALLKTEVVDGVLEISLGERSVSTSSLGEPKLVVTVPQLTRYTMAGAGETTITHFTGDSLSVDYAGAGTLKADGKVKTLKLQIAGVGSIDTKDLIAQNVTANVGGVGSVKVYASESLDADVGGVGSLKYYGNPHTVHKSAGGVGSISKGD
jgi:hypothetical protein